MAQITKAKRARRAAADIQITTDYHITSEDTETMLQDNANAAAAANVSAAPLDSTGPVDPRESAEVPSTPVLQESTGIRPRNGQPTEEDELELTDFLVTENFRNRWASDDVVVAAATITGMKQDPNYVAPVQK